MVSHLQVARDTAGHGLTGLVRMLVLAPPLFALLQVLVNAGDYRQPALAAAAWLVVLGTGARLGLRRRGAPARLGPVATAAAVAVAVAAVAVNGAARRPVSAVGGADLAILGTAGLLALLVLTHRARVWIPAAALVLAVHAALLIRADGLSRPGLSELSAAGYIVAGLLLAFSALRPVLDSRARLAARRASLASRLAAEHAAAAEIGRERRERLSLLERDALPLLRALADGTFDPAADEVRERCARHAAALRSSLGGADWAAGLLGETLRAAAARGLDVTVQLIGDPPVPPPAVAAAVAAAVSAVLDELPPHPAVLTVLAAADEVELYLSFSPPPLTAPGLTAPGLTAPGLTAPARPGPALARLGAGLPPGTGWQAGLTEDGLEISWRAGGAG